MKRLYLIRHAKPDFPENDRMCLGLTDLPLGKLGILQACMLGEEFKNVPLSAVYTSYLTRASRTAEFLSPEPEIVIGLEEMSAGIWDGRLVSEIKENWTELYEERGRDLSTPIPGAEDVYMGQERFADALNEIMENAPGDAAVVSHSTVIQSFLCSALGEEPTEGRKYRMEYCAHSVFDYDGQFHLVEMNVPPVKRLDGDMCIKLLQALGLPEDIIEHSRAVRDEALLIAGALGKKGIELDRGLIENAALLHDIERQSDNHPEEGAKLIAALGYENEADIIRQHHDLETDKLDEAAAVYMADKLVKGSERVSLSERFGGSMDKCRNADARAARERRYAQAKEVCGRIEKAAEITLPL